MDYKRIIKSQKARIVMLKFLNFLPDRFMLKIQYRIKFGRKLNLNEPKRLTEKLQWYKLYYRDPLMTRCAGKDEVRSYVIEKGLGHILNEQIGSYEHADEIEFDKLPEKFVVKETKGAASRKVLVCTDKASLDIEKVRKQVESWIEKDNNKLPIGSWRRRNAGREWAYNDVTSKLVIEKYIDSSTSKNGLLSYKIFCFNGKPRFVYVIADVKDGFFDAGYGIFTTDYKRLPYKRVGEVHLELKEDKPQNWDEMLRIAECLSEDFPHVRVDLYNVSGKIYFGELTFYNDSGYMKYDPDEFDMIAGDMFVLPKRKRV